MICNYSVISPLFYIFFRCFSILSLDNCTDGSWLFFHIVLIIFLLKRYPSSFNFVQQVLPRFTLWSDLKQVCSPLRPPQVGESPPLWGGASCLPSVWSGPGCIGPVLWLLLSVVAFSNPSTSWMLFSKILHSINDTFKINSSKLNGVFHMSRKQRVGAFSDICTS